MYVTFPLAVDLLSVQRCGGAAKASSRRDGIAFCFYCSMQFRDEETSRKSVINRNKCFNGPACLSLDDLPPLAHCLHEKSGKRLYMASSATGWCGNYL